MAEKLKLDIPILLPEVHDERDACVSRLDAMLGDRDGITKVHVLADEEPSKLCIHWDPDVISLGRVRELAEAAGARLSDRYGHFVATVSETDHPRRARSKAEDLVKIEGVLEAEVSGAGAIRVEYDREVLSADELRAEIAEIHRQIRALLRPVGPGAGGGAAFRFRGGQRAVFGELLPGDGGAGGRQPLCVAIATPSAVLSAVAAAGHSGVLVKGGGPLEHLGDLKAMAFDKTGTLTEGEPRVTSVEPVEGVEAGELLGVAVAVERLSHHPLAEAVVAHGEEELEAVEYEARDLESITGRGLRAAVDGQTVLIGKDELFDESDGPDLPEELREQTRQLEQSGQTTMIVRIGERYLGVIGLMDTPRDSAAAMIKRVRQLGIDRMIMISGDNQSVADAVATEVGLDEAHGDLMPDDKVEFIKKLNKNGKVAMVGDGVNDAPAMANASVGIAMGAAGSDTALETAEIALMADDLAKLPYAVGLSRKTSSIIRQNLWLSLGMVVILIPATIAGLHIGPAVALHEGSTVAVVFNALRLLAFRG